MLDAVPSSSTRNIEQISLVASSIVTTRSCLTRPPLSQTCVEASWCSIAQRVVVPFGQLLVKVLHRKALIDGLVQTQHPLDLRHRRTPQRWCKAAVFQPGFASLPVTVPPAAECAFADTKQLRRLHLAQLGPLRPAHDVRETHPPYPFVNACPVHANHPIPEAPQ